MSGPAVLLDVLGFTVRTVMPGGDVSLVQTSAPGYIAAREAYWESWLYSRLRKRYAIPFATTAPSLVASGTMPPAVTLAGTPAVGSDRLAIAIASAGALGSSTFQWSRDGGSTWMSGVAGGTVTAGGSGYTSAPTIAVTAPDEPWGTPATATASVTSGAVTGITTTPGTGYRYPPTFTFSGGGGVGAAATATIARTVIATAASVSLGATGLQAQFPAAGTYGADNAWGAAPAAPETALGWLTALLTPDVYRKRGVNPQDPQLELVEKDKDRVLAEVKEAADAKDGLYDLPLNDETAASAVSQGAPLGYSETSPYAWTDQQIQTACGEDANGRGTNG